MKLLVSLTGSHRKVDAKVRARAFALLMEMEREFANLKVDISDAPKKASSKTGKNG